MAAHLDQAIYLGVGGPVLGNYVANGAVALLGVESAFSNASKRIMGLPLLLRLECRWQPKFRPVLAGTGLSASGSRSGKADNLVVYRPSSPTLHVTGRWQRYGPARCGAIEPGRRHGPTGSWPASLLCHSLRDDGTVPAGQPKPRWPAPPRTWQARNGHSPRSAGRQRWRRRSGDG